MRRGVRWGGREVLEWGVERGGRRGVDGNGEKVCELGVECGRGVEEGGLGSNGG